MPDEHVRGARKGRHQYEPEPAPSDSAQGRGLLPMLRGALRLTWDASHRGFIVAALLQIVGALSATLLVLVGKYALDVILKSQTHGADARTLAPPVILLALVTAGGSAAIIFQQQQQRLLGEQVASAAWEQVLDVTGRVRLESYESADFFDQLQRVKNSALSQPINVTTSIFNLIGGVVSAVGLLIVLATIEPLLVPVLLVGGIPAVVLSRVVSGLEFRFLVRATPLYRSRQYLRNTLTGRDEAKEIRAFGAEPALRARHNSRRAEYVALLRAHVRTRQWYAAASIIVTSVSLGIALGMVVWLLTSGRIALGSAAAAILSVRFLSTSLDQLFRAVGGLLEASTYLADLAAFNRLAIDGDGPGTGVAPSFRSAISISHVSYSYPGSHTQTLDDISFDIEANEVVALVGENGSGKTTLAKLVAGLYTPASGSITWDGIDVRDMEAADVRRGVAVIFQDFVRYQLTALDNIGLGQPDAADDLPAAIEAARLAGAAGFLERLPLSYDTILSKEYKDGHDLSMGQWQRVALARALRKRASLVILDEPTAALDPRAEAALFSDIRATLRGRAALLISHRYSSVRFADCIYVLRAGKIVEAGSHDALMAEAGLYAELFQLQANAYL